MSAELFNELVFIKIATRGKYMWIKNPEGHRILFTMFVYPLQAHSDVLCGSSLPWFYKCHGKPIYLPMGLKMLRSHADRNVIHLQNSHGSQFEKRILTIVNPWEEINLRKKALVDSKLNTSLKMRSGSKVQYHSHSRNDLRGEDQERPAFPLSSPRERNDCVPFFKGTGTTQCFSSSALLTFGAR